ncbi:MAG: DNA polymerase I [Alphaproteobacteria bacterium]|nr:DNA polymerase I [Alphaproteobacteria bacterium]MCB9691879.1 DNA polymerase I [Alphaproteobacteria bacterium]
MSVPRVVLVDGSGLLFRAFNALPTSLATRDGQPTNAIFGFAKMFRRILQGRTPTHGAVVFDAGGKTFRHALDARYKAHRPRMPDALRAQLDGVDRMVEAHGFPIVRQPGVEADDLIATLARQALERGADVTVVSGDKDLLPLLEDPRVRVYDSTADVSFDADRARRTFGVAPERIPDWLALVGDDVDGVPGVPGIGRRLATSLLRDHEGIEALLAAAPELGDVGRKLLAWAERLRLSHRLVTLDRHVDLPVGLDDLALEPATPERLNEAYRTYEIFSLLTAEGPGAGPLAWYVVDSFAMVAAALQNECLGPEPVALHVLTELTPPVHGDVTGIALSPRPGTSFYFPVRGPGTVLGPMGLQALKPWLENPAFPKVAHDAKLAISALQRHGITLRGLVGDSGLAAYLLDPTRSLPHTLEQVARHTLQRALQPLRGVVGGGRAMKRFDALTVDRAGAWANHQADAIGAAWRAQRDTLVEEGLDAVLHDVDLPLAYVLADLELTGILLDPSVIERLGQGFRDERDAVAAEIHALAGREFLIGSTKQLGEVLFDELRLPVIKRNRTGYSTAADVLEKLDHPIVERVLRWRTLDTLVNTWTEVLVDSVDPDTGRIHATFQQTASASGRLITTEPDLQRTPVRNPEFLQLREAFVAPEGSLVVSADWSQIELRVLAHLSRDPVLLEAYHTGADLHRGTAAALFGVPLDQVTTAQRDVGKTVNFATVYGQGPAALAEQLRVPHATAKGFIDTFFRTYAGVAAWRDDVVARAHEDGFVTTLGGRRRYVPELSTRTWSDRAYGERIAMNTPIQGSAADLCKVAMIRVHRELREAGLEARMTLQIHDELLFEVPVDQVDATTAIVREVMEHAWELAVPLVVDVGVGPTWAACK